MSTFLLLNLLFVLLMFMANLNYSQIICENAETLIAKLTANVISSADITLVLNETSTYIINQTIPSILIEGATVTLTCSQVSVNGFCTIYIFDSDSIFDITMDTTSQDASFTLNKIQIIPINSHQDIISINKDSTGGTLTISSSLINSGRIIHGSPDVLLDIDNAIFTQSHIYTLDNWEDYEDTIPKEGGYIISEEQGSVLINNSRFDNCAALEGGCVYCKDGGIEIYNSVFTNGIAFDGKGGLVYTEDIKTLIIGSSSFSNGISNGDDGGCLMTDSGKHLDIYDTEFDRCLAFDAGALNAEKYDLVTITNVNVTNCHADSKGGGIRLKKTDLVILEALYIVNNTAGFNGGALHLDTASDIVSANNCEFFSNSASYAGGAIHVETGNLIVNNSLFLYNTAPNGGVGSITAETAEMSFTFINTVFKYNYGIQGGVLWLLYGSYFLNNISCKYNDAIQLGGCIWDGNVEGEGITSTVMNSEISYNSASTAGGGIYFSGTSLSLTSNIFTDNIVYGGIGGGALSILKDIIIKYYNNIAITNGGGIFGEKIFDTAESFIIHSCLFDNNTAQIGGSIYLEDLNAQNSNSFNIVNMDNYAINLNPYKMNGESKIWEPIITNSIFSNNNKNNIYLLYVNINLESNIFRNNYEGPAISIDSGIIKDENSMFLNNSNRNGCGGAIQTINTLDIILNQSLFRRNLGLNGGAVCSDICPMNDSTEDVVMNNNMVYESGGAIQLESNIDIQCMWCQTDTCNISNNYILNNNSLSLSSYASSHSSWILTTNIQNHSKIDNSFEISIEAQLYDSYSNPIEYLSDFMSLKVDLNDNTQELKILQSLDEGNNEIFNENTGYASIQFLINNDNVIVDDKNKVYDVLLNIKTNPLFYTETYSLTYQLRFDELNTGFIIFIIILIVLTMLFICSTFPILYFYRNARIIRGSTVPFMIVILFGLFLSCLGLLFRIISPKPYSCILSFILLHFSILLVIGPIGGKTWRLYRIFNGTKNLKVFIMSHKQLAIYFIIIPSILLLIYIILWIVISSPGVSILSSTNNPIDSYYYISCVALNNTINDSVFMYISLFICGLPIIWLTIISYESRKLPKDFNETFWIGASLYSILLNGILCIPILISSVNYALKLQLTSIASIITINCIIIFLFWVKFYKAKKNINKAGNTESTTKSNFDHSSHNSSNDRTRMRDGDKKTRPDSPTITMTSL